jgi:hypothetical protein
MKKDICWLLAIVLTAYLAVLQLVMESTYPIVTEVNTGKQKISLQLIRSFEGDQACPIIFPIEDIAVKGYLRYNLKSDTLKDEKVDLKREGDKLIGYLPGQVPATEMEYRIFLEREKIPLTVNEGKPVAIKFKGKVPLYLILANGFFITLVLLLSSLTGFYAVFGIKSYRWMIYLTVISSLFLSIFLYPLVQKYSLNIWSYMPKIWSLDSKILLASLIWLIALLLSLFLRKLQRIWPVFASIITIGLFLIPHPNTHEPVKITFDLLQKNFVALMQLF